MTAQTPNTSLEKATPVAEVLRKALEAFGPNGENWTQGYRAKPQGPGPFDYPFCCIGTSFNRINTFNRDKDKGLSALAKAAGLCESCELPYWNDDPQRTFADVKALFEKAIAKAERGQ